MNKININKLEWNEFLPMLSGLFYLLLLIFNSVLLITEAKYAGILLSELDHIANDGLSHVNHLQNSRYFVYRLTRFKNLIAILCF